VVKGRIVNSDGEVQSTFPAEGLQFHRLTANHVFYATKKEFVKTEISGAEEWRLPTRVEKFEASRDGQRVIVNHGEDTRTVLHYQDATQIGTASFETVVWNLAFSPSGKFSVATTQKEAHVFSEGQLTHSAALPVEYTISADISDRGEVIIGAQDTDHTGRLLLLDDAGEVAWLSNGDIDDHAFRPHVRFYQDEDHFIVLDNSGLTAFSINRSN
ncbi:MAG: hypothetical protein GY835_22835, partial [bacterium]|nr:hypothetical protein [bacterium]